MRKEPQRKPRRKPRTLFVILFGLPLLLITPLVLVGSSVYHSGTIEVRVVDKTGEGCCVGAHVPAVVVPLALRLAPGHVLDEIRGELDEEAIMGLEIARAVLEELSRAPDGVLIDVRTRTELVAIEKRDGKLRVYVDTPDEVVQASIPLGTLKEVVRAI
jgi:hypothetical protein